jgi:porphyrinogen peroxidase
VPEGNHDRILDFSTAVTGSLYFVPTVEMLDTLTAPDPDPLPEPPPPPARPPSPGSLGIGGLKHS